MVEDLEIAMFRPCHITNLGLDSALPKRIRVVTEQGSSDSDDSRAPSDQPESNPLFMKPKRQFSFGLEDIACGISESSIKQFWLDDCL
jgi:hypothetical protein